jgi:hypothetical protein
MSAELMAKMREEVRSGETDAVMTPSAGLEEGMTYDGEIGKSDGEVRFNVTL